jgi:hypothetical protein
MGALAMAAVGFTKLATNCSIPTPDACRNRSARTASITNSSIPSQQQIFSTRTRNRNSKGTYPPVLSILKALASGFRVPEKTLQNHKTNNQTLRGKMGNLINPRFVF